MELTFTCHGHENIRALHVKTLEFTKDESVTERGDCIVGCRATFDRLSLKQFSKKIRVICSVVGEDGKTIESIFKCRVNPDFDDDRECVLRKSFHRSRRTFGVGLNRGANRMDRAIVERMQDPEATMTVTIKSGWA